MSHNSFMETNSFFKLGLFRIPQIVGRPFGQKNVQGHNAGRPKKVVDSKQKKISFTSINTTVNNNENNNPLSSSSSINSTATPVQEGPTSSLAEDDHVPLGENIFDTMVPSAEEDQYDVFDEDDILDEIDCNDKDEEEDNNRQEGTEDIIDTTSQTAHHHNANNTTEENRNESSNTSNNNATQIAGVIQKYLSDVQKRIVSEKYPAEYSRGTFWVRPKDPYFALLDDLNLNGLYYPHIFLWLPHLLLEKLGYTLSIFSTLLIIDEATALSSSSSSSTEEETSNTEHANSTVTLSSNEIIHNNNTTNTIEPTIFYNPYLPQQLLYPPFPFIYAAPSSSNSTFDGLHAPPRVRHHCESQLIDFVNSVFLITDPRNEAVYERKEAQITRKRMDSGRRVERKIVYIMKADELERTY
ncbi:hypothetical protein INT45_002474 [Circinella minor]|uniref:Uncharacterized protein n=1 Tax=Circinella minor TaxID=1195481 RepID=A0A8H7SCK1_9FUNG|nr:hypothetical protein INT45_002474 [Circinella minor]